MSSLKKISWAAVFLIFFATFAYSQVIIAAATSQNMPHDIIDNNNSATIHITEDIQFVYDMAQYSSKRINIISDFFITFDVNSYEGFKFTNSSVFLNQRLISAYYFDNFASVSSGSVFNFIGSAAVFDRTSFDNNSSALNFGAIFLDMGLPADIMIYAEIRA